ncbi:unnamed protein product [Chilo suppressalis]|uniref:Homeobox domain-containing protein n=1 Tax=Chilo suppressalis TaxID=168631 RepID=A0ABN8B8B7_CHISP|nr:unnamed protein product [Chilo suppressalis]
MRVSTSPVAVIGRRNLGRQNGGLPLVGRRRCGNLAALQAGVAWNKYKNHDKNVENRSYYIDIIYATSHAKLPHPVQQFFKFTYPIHKSIRSAFISLGVKIWFQNRRTKWKKKDNITNAEVAEFKQQNKPAAEEKKEEPTKEDPLALDIFSLKKLKKREEEEDQVQPKREAGVKSYSEAKELVEDRGTNLSPHHTTAQQRRLHRTAHDLANLRNDRSGFEFSVFLKASRYEVVGSTPSRKPLINE